MASLEMITRFSTFMKRRSYSKYTIKSYTNYLGQFFKWLDIQVEKVLSEDVYEYLGYLHNRRLKPKTINSILTALRRFYDFLYYEEKIEIVNLVKQEYRQREPKPIPSFLREVLNSLRVGPTTIAGLIPT